jgi:hypothetical protein
MTGIDAVAGWAHLSGFLGTESVWWIELYIAPFAVISIPLIMWCLRNWPVDEEKATGPSTQSIQPGVE